VRLVHLAVGRLEARGDSMTSKAGTDPIVQRAGVLDMARLYLAGADPRAAAGLADHGDLAGLAPLLIQVGAARRCSTTRSSLARLAGAADVHVDLQIWPEMIHVRHLFHPELAAGLARARAGGRDRPRPHRR